MVRLRLELRRRQARVEAPRLVERLERGSLGHRCAAAPRTTDESDGGVAQVAMEIPGIIPRDRADAFDGQVARRRRAGRDFEHVLDARKAERDGRHDHAVSRDEVAGGPSKEDVADHDLEVICGRVLRSPGARGLAHEGVALRRGGDRRPGVRRQHDRDQTDGNGPEREARPREVRCRRDGRARQLVFPPRRK
jgi:hypothetical protein